MASADETTAFLPEAWPSFPVDSCFTIGCIKDRRYEHLPFDLAVIIRKAAEWEREGKDVHFGVSSRQSGLNDRKLGKNTECVWMPGLFLDIDIQAPSGVHAAAGTLPPDLGAAQEVLSWAPFRPSSIVYTGYGIHAYWWFDHPLFCSGPELRRARKTLSGFQKIFIERAESEHGWHIDTTGQPFRVLRLPGTSNFKVPGDPKEVFVMHREDLRLPVEIWEDALKPRIGRPPATATPSPTTSPSGAPSLSDGTWIGKVREGMALLENRERRAQLQKILAGESFAPGGGRDTEMQRVCSSVAFLALRFIPEDVDPEAAVLELAEIFRPSMAVWAAEPGARKTEDEEMDKIREKLSRALQDAEAKKEAEQARVDRLAGMLARVNARAISTNEALQLPYIPPAPPTGPDDDPDDGPPPPPSGAPPAPPDAPPAPPGTLASVTDALASVTDALASLLAEAPPPCPAGNNYNQRHTIIQRRRGYFIFNAEKGKYMADVISEELEVALRDYLPSEFHWAENSEGEAKRKPVKEIMQDYCTVAQELYFDLTITQSWFDAQKGHFYWAPCPIRPLEPEYDAVVDAWLRVFGGADAEQFLDWLATMTRLDRQTCALYCVGPTGSGKGMLASGLARLWTEGQPTDIEQALGNFNGDILRCPLIVADESLPKHTDSAALRRLVGSSDQTVTRKNMPTATLKGSLRLLLLANNENMMAFKEPLESMDLEAVAGRFLHISIPPESAQFLKDIGGREGTDGWVDGGDKIARHVLWLARNRGVIPSGRFLVEGHATRMHRSLLLNAPSSSLVLQWLSSFLERSSISVSKNEYKLVGDGKLLITATAISDSWDSYVKSQGVLSMARIGRTLKSLSVARPQTDGKRFHEVNTDLIFEWAEQSGVGDIDAMKNRLNKIPSEEEPKQRRASN